MPQTPTFGKSPTGRFFIKMHGLQNHFVITDARDVAYRPSDDEVIRVCNPKAGVGADQLLILQPPTEQGLAGGASAFMRILNIDGREVEACGNATRCVAWLLMQESGSDAITLETLAGTIDCRKAGDHVVSCVMGKISRKWQDVPLAEERDTLHVSLDNNALSDGVALNIGNPHIVFFVDDLDEIDIRGIAPTIQHDRLFPEQVNVGVAEILAEDHMRLQVFERGAGLTSACGSGACAAVYAARARGLTDSSTMDVTLPAGNLTIEIRRDGNAVMTGPVAWCFSGYYSY